MDENTKWLVVINQRYPVTSFIEPSCPTLVTGVTQLVSLSLGAGSAIEAGTKAEEWLEKSGIKDAYVSQVCRDGLDEIEVD